MSEPKYKLYDWVFTDGCYGEVRPRKVTGVMMVKKYGSSREGNGRHEWLEISWAYQLDGKGLCNFLEDQLFESHKEVLKSREQ